MANYTLGQLLAIGELMVDIDDNEDCGPDDEAGISAYRIEGKDNQLLGFIVLDDESTPLFQPAPPPVPNILREAINPNQIKGDWVPGYVGQ